MLKKILEKKRSERSSSGESSTSPDAKTLRSVDVNFPEEVEEHEADNEIFTASNMVEGLHKTLEEINRKLEKLDAVQTLLQKLEGRIQKLECSQTTANRDIENLTKNFKAVVKQQQKLATSLQDNREETSLALTDLQKANDDLQVKLKEIEDKNFIKKHTRDGKT